MPSVGFLEWLMSRFTPQDRAAAILGDLLETAEMRGRVWFWVAATRVLARLAWREPMAWAAGYGMLAIVYSISTTGDLASNTIGNNVPEPNGVVPTLALSVVAGLSLPLLFMAPYGAVRFGLRDAMSRLAVPLCVMACLGFWLCHPQAMGIRSAAVEQALMIGCAAVVLALVVAALVLRQWRVVVALGAAGCAAVGVTIGIVNILLLLALRYEWSYNVRWVLVRVGSAIACWIVACVYSMMHGLLRSRLRRFLIAACVVAVAGLTLGNVPEPPPGFGAGDPHLSAFSMATAERGGRARQFLTVTKPGRTALMDSQRAYQRLLLRLNLLRTNTSGNANA